MDGIFSVFEFQAKEQSLVAHARWVEMSLQPTPIPLAAFSNEEKSLSWLEAFFVWHCLRQRPTVVASQTGGGKTSVNDLLFPLTRSFVAGTFSYNSSARRGSQGSFVFLPANAMYKEKGEIFWARPSIVWPIY